MTWNKEFASNVIKLRKLSSKFTDGFVVYSGRAIGTCSVWLTLNGLLR